ncbi:hypothetical protein BGZ94_009940 [Podila epigama]|nr:hypothetical protein BGZ94_009940 [Podila epigama]
MIQCETCKVWQHCPCVGLGNGEVTPDKYYCDSCRPQNHPYKVVNGVLISNTKRTTHAQAAPAVVPSLKTPMPKKRNTMNSKEASIPVDLMLAQQKWNDEHMDEIEDTTVKSHKRRRKNGSTTHEEDEEHLKSKDDDADEAKRALSLDIYHSESKKSLSNSSSGSAGKSDGMELVSPKTEGSHSGNGRTNNNSHKKSNRSPPTSTTAAQLQSPVCEKSPKSTSSSLEAESSSPSNAMDSTAGERKESESPPSSSSNKRRKGIKSETPSRSESTSRDDDQDEFPQATTPKMESNGPSRSRKNGSSKGVKRSDNSNNINNNSNSASSNTNGSNNNNNVNNSGDASEQEDAHEDVSVQPSKTYMNKRVCTKRSERNNNRNSSRHSTPIPHGSVENGTPQPMAPPAPATVRYPSSKMSIHDMTKRAKQLLDYISRVQVDMADRKSKCGMITPPKSSSTTAGPKTHPENGVMAEAGTRSSEPFSLPTAVQIASVSGISLMHGATTGSIVGLDEVHLESKEMTIKVPHPNEGRDSMLLSTPPLSVHDISHLDSHDHRHHDHDHHDSHHQASHEHDQYRTRRHSGMTTSPGSEFESSMGHEPITPPHQPVEHSDKLGDMEQTSSGLREGTHHPVSSLELMDKLTGDLIRFQERFGAYE